jgi:hypothetical protein
VEVGAPVSSMGHYFVKRLVTRALDRKDKEREMASSLLSNLYAEVSTAVPCCTCPSQPPVLPATAALCKRLDDVSRVED